MNSCMLSCMDGWMNGWVGWMGPTLKWIEGWMDA